VTRVFERERPDLCPFIDHQPRAYEQKNLRAMKDGKRQQMKHGTSEEEVEEGAS
jgi:hypothetical protein